MEIEDVPAGNYDLKVGGTSVGDIHATMDKDGKVQGEAEFRDPVEPGKTLLDFDPRGQTIEVLDGTERYTGCGVSTELGLISGTQRP